MTRRQLPPSSALIRQLRNIIVHHHADLDGACAAIGVDKARLTSRQTLDLQQSYRQATSLLRASLMARVLDSKDDDRLLAIQIDARERLQVTWPSPDSVSHQLYENQPDDVLEALEAFYSGDENAFEKLVEQRVHSRLIALLGPGEADRVVNGKRRRRLEVRNVSVGDGKGRYRPPDPVQKILPSSARDHPVQKIPTELGPDQSEPEPEQYSEPIDQITNEQQPARSSFWSVQNNSGIQGPTLHIEDFEQPIKKNRSWPPTGSKRPDHLQPYFNEQGRLEE